MVSCKFISNGKIKYNDVKLSNKHFENDEKKTVTPRKTNKPSEQNVAISMPKFLSIKHAYIDVKKEIFFSLNPKYFLTSRFNFFMTFAFLIVMQKHSRII